VPVPRPPAGTNSELTRTQGQNVVRVNIGPPASFFRKITSGGPLAYAQFYQPGNRVLKSDASGSLLPITAATHAVAAGRRGPFFSDATVGGTPVRILTEPVAATDPATGAQVRGVLQAALSTTDMDDTLASLRLVLVLVCLGGVLLAAVLGLLVSRAALVPVRRLTGAAERVARTQNLGHRISASEQDELGRLAGSFNTMLAALERSRLAQRQLISDASHELRTPLASVQANLDALTLGEHLSAPDRARALAAAQAQLGELAVLVGDLVDLSKTEVDRIELEDVRLDLAAAGALERARLHAPQCRFELTAEPCLVRAAPAKLDRAISNLLENAVKWGPPEGPVEVEVHAGVLAVRDHGPGIDPQDLPRVFDRFYRSPAARSRPGSGLGLAIVRHVAESHGGAVHAVNDPGGGARLTLELEPLPMSEDERAGARAWAKGDVQEPPRQL
jgi:two-component system sensor histidine kinase MprB